ncbi:hypothetical protein VN24_16235 [Paenibacillus beijingensis]|uniref:Uncharacterized protein n=1 Tax=Paenibacillus beijingensis TaxID=1126833 RepID=A0A0D5NLL3_9BACL|nr:hypothetical protein VN24_16235 [Paenibacillus beijingensis]
MKPGNRRNSTVLILAETTTFLGDERGVCVLSIRPFLELREGVFLYAPPPGLVDHARTIAPIII